MPHHGCTREVVSAAAGRASGGVKGLGMREEGTSGVPWKPRHKKGAQPDAGLHALCDVASL